MDLHDIADLYEEEMVKLHGFDECCVGVVTGFNRQAVFAYDYDMMIAKLMEDGMSEEDAEEHHDFNQAGAYMGEGTPVFIHTKFFK